ncbi:MAG: O-antigen ligase family protein [Agathobacter sp.]
MSTRFAKIIKYLMIFCSVLGANILSYGVGSFQLTPYRILLLFSILLVVLMPKTRVIRIVDVNSCNVFRMFLIWIAISFISVLWSKDLSGWIQHVYFIVAGFISFIVIYQQTDSEEDLIGSLKSLNMAIFLQSLIGMYEIITNNYLFRTLSGKDYILYVQLQSRIPIAMMHNPNDYGTLMFIGCYLSLFCLLYSKKQRLINIVILAFELITLFMSQSRANILALIVSALFVFFSIDKKAKKSWMYVLLFLIVVPIIAVLYWPNLSSLLQFNFVLGVNQSDSIRMGLLLNGLHYFISSFGFGVGAGQVGYWLSNNPVYFCNNVTDIHNWWAELLVDYGLIFFICYMYYYLHLIRGCMLRKKSKENGFCYIVLCSLLVGYVIASVSSSSNMIKEHIWILFSIIACIHKVNAEDIIL